SAAVASGPILDVRTAGAVCRLTLNRPDQRNALSRDLLEELETALANIAKDSSIRVVVLAAHGAVFCSGHDLKEMSGCTEAQYRELFTLCSRVMQQLPRVTRPVSAGVHGR